MAWPLSDKFGRKPALLLSTFPGLMGWIVISIGNLLPTRKGFLAMIYTGRLLSGFFAGWTVFCVSVRHTYCSDSVYGGVCIRRRHFCLVTMLVYYTHSIVFTYCHVNVYTALCLSGNLTPEISSVDCEFYYEVYVWLVRTKCRYVFTLLTDLHN